MESFFQELKKKGKNSIAFRLAKDFPQEGQYIEERATSFVQMIKKEVEDASTINTFLPQEIVSSAENFYTIKAEKQMRGFYRLTVAKTLMSFIADLQDLYAKTRQRGGVIPVAERKESMRDIEYIEKEDDFKIRLPLGEKNSNFLEEENVNQENEIILDEEKIDSLKAGLLDSLPEHERRKGQKNFLTTYEGEKTKLPFSDLIRIIQSHPTLKMDVKKRFENEVSNRERYSRRKVCETLGILNVVARDYHQGEKILDLCTGSGDITIVASSGGYTITGVDLNKFYLRLGRLYSTLLQRESNTKDRFNQADIVNDTLPSAEVWIAKHPCAPKMALPDTIISRFANDLTAKKLYLLTCCANKSIGCCPIHYQETGVITSEKWDDACIRTSDAGVEDKQKEREVQLALREINEARVSYIRETLGLYAEIVEIPGTIMNQMIVIKK